MTVVPRPARNSSRAVNAPLLANTIAANVNSATGTALAVAADVTTISRSQSASVAIGLTVPAALATSARRGARTNTSSVNGGQNHPAMRISVVRSSVSARASVNIDSGA